MVEELSRVMQNAWLSFARTGDPSDDGSVEWPRWEKEERATMIFGARTGRTNAPRNEELAVLQRHRPLIAAVPA